MHAIPARASPLLPDGSASSPGKPPQVEPAILEPATGPSCPGALVPEADPGGLQPGRVAPAWDGHDAPALNGAPASRGWPGCAGHDGGGDRHDGGGASHDGAGARHGGNAGPHSGDAGPHGGDAAITLAPRPAGGGRGNPNLAPRCGAKTRAGLVCRAPAMTNGRCRLHGGKSTGPRTTAGLAKVAAARTTHGNQGAAKRAQQRYVSMTATRIRLFCAAVRLRPYLVPEVAARLATTPAEFIPPERPRQAPVLEISDRTLWSAGRNGRGRFVARPRPALRGQAAEREAARVERQALAPWRAAIAEAKLVRRAVLAGRRAVLAQRRAARIEKSGQDPMEPRTVVPAVAVGMTTDGVPADVTSRARRGAPERTGGGTVDLGRGEVGEKAVIGKFMQGPLGTSPGAGIDPAQRAGQDTAGGGGTVRGALGAARGEKAGIGKIVQGPLETSHGAGIDRARPAGQDAAGGGGTVRGALGTVRGENAAIGKIVQGPYRTPDGARTEPARRVGHGAAGGTAGIRKIPQRPYGPTDGGRTGAATPAGRGGVGDAGAAAARVAAGGLPAPRAGAPEPMALADGIRRMAVEGTDGRRRSQVATKLARVATLHAFRAAYPAACPGKRDRRR